jgi:hypothetical protein
MNLHPQKEILKWVLDTLKGDATLTAIVPATRIVENMPDFSAYPHIRVAPAFSDDWSSHTFDGFRGEIHIRVWTQGQSVEPNMDALNRIYTLLHDMDPSIPTFPTINFRCTFNEPILEPDGRTYQGLQRYSFTLGGND